MKKDVQKSKETATSRAIVLFLGAGFVVLLVAHFFLWLTLADFFSLGAATRIFLGCILFFLAVSFLLANLLERQFKNATVKTFYFLSAVWLGFFVNLFFSFVILWPVYFIFRLIGFHLSEKILVEVFILLPAGLTLGGMYRAYHPFVRSYRLKISRLPAAWRGKKIVQLSDLHLGLSNGVAFLKRVATLTNVQKPDLIFITGDLFDGGDGNLDEFALLLNRLEASRGVYFVTGNHETYLGLAAVFAALTHTPIQILDDQALDIDGLRLIGLGYPAPGVKKDMAAVLKNLAAKNQPQLLLFHAPTHLREFSAFGIDVLFAGHTHRGQIFPFGFVTRAIFHGHDRDLTRSGKMRVWVSSGTGTWGPPVKTSGRTEIAVFTLS